MAIPRLNAGNDNVSAESDILVMFRSFPKRPQHQFIQLAIDEMGLDHEAEQSPDAFLASVARLIEDGDEYHASDLYPRGRASSGLASSQSRTC